MIIWKIRTEPAAFQETSIDLLIDGFVDLDEVLQSSQLYFYLGQMELSQLTLYTIF